MSATLIDDISVTKQRFTQYPKDCPAKWSAGADREHAPCPQRLDGGVDRVGIAR